MLASFFKIYFFLIVCVCVNECNTFGDQKGVPDTLKQSGSCEWPDMAAGNQT